MEPYRKTLIRTNTKATLTEMYIRAYGEPSFSTDTKGDLADAILAARGGA